MNDGTKRVLIVNLSGDQKKVLGFASWMQVSITAGGIFVGVILYTLVYRLLTGPTGCGKTMLAKTLAKMLGVPFAIADATTLTAAGYVGEDVENVVRYLWQNANYDIPMTQIGIIYIDEIDKIASKTQNVSITKDVGGQEVQNTLLKIIEGTICRFPPNSGFCR